MKAEDEWNKLGINRGNASFVEGTECKRYFLRLKDTNTFVSGYVRGFVTFTKFIIKAYHTTDKQIAEILATYLETDLLEIVTNEQLKSEKE